MKKSVFKDLIKFELKKMKNFYFGTILAFLGYILLSMLPFLLVVVQENIVNDSESNKNSNKIIEGIYYIILMFAIGLVGFLITFFSRWFLAKYAADQINNIRLNLFFKITKLSPQATFKYSATSLNNRLSIDVGNYFNFFSFLCIDFIPAISRTIVFVIASIAINPLLSTLYIVLIPIVLFPTLFLTKYANKFYAANAVSNDNLNKIVSENIVGIKIVKALNLYQREEKRFSEYNQKLRKDGFKADSYTILWFPFILAFIYGVFGILLLVSGLIEGSDIDFGRFGNISAGEIISFSTYLFLALFAVFECALLAAKKERAKPSADRIREILDIKDSIFSKKNLHFENGNIRFENVNLKFSQQAQDNVLSNINFEIKKGERVAIVGPTGSGKSVLIKMISRGFDPSEGNVYINNVNIKDFNVKNLIENISIIFQDKQLFSGTIKENIKFSNKDLGSSELNEIARKSQAKEFILNKKNNYAFKLNQKGSNLSGGQQQRISIARGLAKKAPILILDDTTSALDNITEKKINDELNEIKNKTIIVVSQRIKPIMNLKKIIVVNDGFIVGIGNHKELLNNCKVYNEICSSQGIN